MFHLQSIDQCICRYFLASVIIVNLPEMLEKHFLYRFE